MDKTGTIKIANRQIIYFRFTLTPYRLFYLNNFSGLLLLLGLFKIRGEQFKQSYINEGYMSIKLKRSSVTSCFA